EIGQLREDLGDLSDSITTALGLKANASAVYTKAEVDAKAGVTTVASASGSSLTLTAASARFQAFTPSVAGAPVALPDATTLVVGTVFRVHNRSLSLTVYITDGAGRKIAQVSPMDTLALT